MKKDGFTLIELLAVIVILAIIALIAVPIILNIIGDAKKESDERSKELYLNAVEQAIARKNLTEEFNPTECTVKSDGNISCTQGETKVNLTVEAEGTRPTGGTITLKDGVIASENLVFGGSDVQGDEPQVPEAVSFETDSWDTIIENVQNGFGDMYKEDVGKTKTIHLNGDFNKDYKVRLANTSTPDECKGEGFSETACGFVVEFVDIISKQKMNSTETTVGGWEASEMRPYLNEIKEKEGSGAVFKALPQELQSAIKETKVISGHESGKDTNYTTEDKLYLLSTREVYGTEGSIIRYDSVTIETRQLDYYKDVAKVTGSSYSGAIKNYEDIATIWWLRSAHSLLTNSFFNVRDHGDCNNYTANSILGVAPAFRLG